MPLALLVALVLLAPQGPARARGREAGGRGGPHPGLALAAPGLARR